MYCNNKFTILLAPSDNYDRFASVKLETTKPSIPLLLTTISTFFNSSGSKSGDNPIKEILSLN